MSQQIFLRRLFVLAAWPLWAGAETPQSTDAAPASAMSAGSTLQMLAGLLVVLAVVGAAAWLLKRFAANPGTAAGTIKVIAAAAVGQRERVVLVEIGGTWLVLGVAPGQVSALHSMTKVSAEQFDYKLLAQPPNTCQTWLRQVMEKHNAG